MVVDGSFAAYCASNLSGFNGRHLSRVSAIGELILPRFGRQAMGSMKGLFQSPQQQKFVGGNPEMTGSYDSAIPSGFGQAFSNPGIYRELLDCAREVSAIMV